MRRLVVEEEELEKEGEVEMGIWNGAWVGSIVRVYCPFD